VLWRRVSGVAYATPAYRPGGHTQQRRSEPPVRKAVSPHRSPMRARSATALEAASVSDRPPASSPGAQPPTAQASGDGTLPPPVRRAGQTAAVTLAGSLDYATVVRNRPDTLGTWRVTMTSRRTADRVAELLGGRVQQDLTSGLVEVLTTSPTVDVLLTGPPRSALHGSTPPTAATASPKATAAPAPARLALRSAGLPASRAAAAGPAPSSGSGSPAARASAPSALPARTGPSSSWSPGPRPRCAVDRPASLPGRGLACYGASIRSAAASSCRTPAPVVTLLGDHGPGRRGGRHLSDCLKRTAP
jgi:hypothetical protein